MVVRVNVRMAGRKPIGEKPKKSINVMIDVELHEKVKALGNVSATIDMLLRKHLEELKKRRKTA